MFEVFEGVNPNVQTLLVFLFFPKCCNCSKQNFTAVGALVSLSNYSHCFSASLKAANMFVLQVLNSYHGLSSKWKSNTSQNCGLSC